MNCEEEIKTIFRAVKGNGRQWEKTLRGLDSEKSKLNARVWTSRVSSELEALARVGAKTSTRQSLQSTCENNEKKKSFQFHAEQKF